ncbi:leucyl aminopeptidase family protein [Methylocystis sp. MJC1]|uniref:leucyl aminopeptidase family protein n=2 Tax=Methylocystis sp. MJC1 TaxID=2654282 RepID=UPI0013EC0EA5|nr:leucyl aminopeptidase family protein [Methylocystis sp. MJC1]KAF2992272.1 putative cytosol aminopeptidase [Methylocystis sp. MJC1]UZX10362.1 leucyl aminopeptidase family protein [Methylocystis sp. MJC1]
MTMKLQDWSAEAITIDFVDKGRWRQVKEGLPATVSAIAAANGFEAKPGSLLIAPALDGAPARVFFGVEAPDAKKRDPFLAGKLAASLPAGLYRLGDGVADPQAAALAFLLASYSFSRYVAPKGEKPCLCAPQGIDRARVERIASAVALGRDLVNTPANDMGPEALAESALALAAKYGAQSRVIVGDALLAENFPLIHAVGRAAAQAPRLVEFTHGPEDGFKVTLVGKGVCYDTGGLDIKPSSAMALMKKDMGGAAMALALAAMLMDADVPVRLRVLLPIVENSISSNAFRTGDIYRSRKGLTVEVGNTDAEGRLILADALAYAAEDQPDLLFDFATLTGAARVALGPELPPFFTEDDALADEIAACGRSANDPVWRLPLWENYDGGLDGKISDLVSVTSGGFSGSIVAALFLRRFVSDPGRWAHFDVYCWNPSTKPGRPEGGEAQAARLLYDLIETRAKKKATA